MRHLSITPSIEVTIGRETRSYCPFVTTAPTTLDSPSTVTLYAADFCDVAGLSADPVTCRSFSATTPTRLVLVDALEYEHQRAKYREGQHLLLPADRVLVSLTNLQLWLWRRLQTPHVSEVLI